MMLAHAKYLDIAGQNHLTVVYIKKWRPWRDSMHSHRSLRKEEHSSSVLFGVLRRPSRV
jgi:hypothetical protein